jgi:hypothetical protein
MPKGQRKVLTDKERAEKLQKIASPRVSRALRVLKQVGQLKRYKPTSAQQNAILRALEDGISNVKASFAGTETKAEFELPKS